MAALDFPFLPSLERILGRGSQVDTDLQLLAQAVNALNVTLHTFLAGNAVVFVGTTAMKNALTLPPTGLLFYDTTLGHLQTNTGTPGAPVWSNP